MQLTNTQLVLLSKAAQHEDHVLEPPASLAGGAIQAVAASLIKRGLASETPARGDMPIWRRDAQEAPIALIATTAGLEAIGIDTPDRAIPPEHPVDSAALPSASDVSSSAAETRGAPDTPSAPAAAAIDTAPRAPRDGTKLEMLLALLERDEGATLDDLMGASGWLPHTTRAAMTGLRKRGYTIDTVREKGKPTVYRILGPATGAEVEADAGPGDDVESSHPTADDDISGGDA